MSSLYQLQVDVPQYLEDVLADIVGILPELVGAIIILVVGYIVGRAVGRFVAGLADRVGLDRAVADTTLGRILGGTERAVSRTFGALARWIVYGLTILAAANVLAITLLSEWLSTAVSYLPAFVAGLLVILLGFVIADFIGDAIMSTRAATSTGYTKWFADGTRMFLYFTAVVIGLDTMGIDVTILFVFARALAWGIAAAIALGVGIGVGWGSKDYVAENIDGWLGRAGSATPSPRSRPAGDGGSTPGEE